MDPTPSVPSSKSTKSAKKSTNEEDDGGEWSIIKEKKSKKKKKSASRPLPLHVLFSSSSQTIRQQLQLSAEPSALNYGSTSSDSAAGGHCPRPPEGVRQPKSEVEGAEVLRRAIVERLRQQGPMHVEDRRVGDEMARSCSEDTWRVIDEYGGTLRNFLIDSPDIVQVDNYLCVKADRIKARTLAVERVTNNTGPRTAAAASTVVAASTTPAKPPSASSSPLPATTMTAAVIGSVATAPPTPQVWPRTVPPPNILTRPPPPSLPPTVLIESPPPVHVGPNVKHPIGTPNMAVPPPPIISSAASTTLFRSSPSVLSSLSTSSATAVIGPSPNNGFGSIGVPSKLPDDASSASSDSFAERVTEMQKRMDKLELSNLQLNQKLVERSKQLQDCETKYSDLKKTCEELQKKLREAQEEMSLIDAKNGSKAAGSASPVLTNMVSDKELIIKLQQELEGERLHSQTLQNQLSIERSFNNRKFKSMSGGFSDTSRPFSSSLGGTNDDFLGLKNILDNVGQRGGSIGTNGQSFVSQSTAISTAPAIPTSLAQPPPIGNGFRGAGLGIIGPMQARPLPPASQVISNNNNNNSKVVLPPPVGTNLPPPTTTKSTAVPPPNLPPPTSLSRTIGPPPGLSIAGPSPLPVKELELAFPELSSNQLQTHLVLLGTRYGMSVLKASQQDLISMIKGQLMDSSRAASAAVSLPPKNST